jgi:hypothetical protein
MIYTIYNPATGQIQATYTTLDNQVIPENAVAGSFSSKTHYVDQGQAVQKPTAPVSITKYYFDYETKTWQVDVEKSSQAVRTVRNDLLAAIDGVNYVWYSALTPSQQQELVAYRQALLDITQQAGFPGLVQWPTKPSWF